MQTHHLAYIAYAANRALQRITVDPAESPAWEDATEENRAILIEGVRGLVEHADTPEQAHERWRTAKAAAGWSWGPVKDPARRTHPAMVPWSELMEHERARTRLLHAVVNALKDYGEWTP